MKNIEIKKILKGLIKFNTNININGWVKTKRDSKIGLSFILINDGSSCESLQIIANDKLINYKQDILNLTSGCSISVFGILKQSIGNKQKFEVYAKKIKLIGMVDNPSNYPISAKHHTLEYLRNFSHLRSRTNIIGSVSRLRHYLSYLIHKFMHRNNFYWIHTPIITTLDTEGNGKLFRVSNLNFKEIYNNKKNINYKKDFFGKEAFLTVSGQLNAECYACSLSKIYTFGPTFRAENSNTSRHLSEFWMIEPEVAFANINDIICFSEKFLKYLFKNILKKGLEEILFFSKINKKNIILELEKNINNKFIQIEYSEAINILNKDSNIFNIKPDWGINLFSEHERYLVDSYFRAPVIIKNYPKKIKPFYMRENIDNKTVASFDILMPRIGEIIGGSQREERLENLDKNLKKMKLNINNYWWYRDLRRYGTVIHSGFGLGLERLILYLSYIKNIRDVIPFPRFSKNANF